MKKHVADHLRTLFPQIRKFNFEKTELLGPDNIERMINILRSSDSLSEQIRQKENFLEEITNDLFTSIETSLYLSYLRIKLGHYKVVKSNLLTIYNNLVKKGGDNNNLPFLPTLRGENYFVPGDDVMCYVSDDTTHFGSDAAFKWICAKVITVSGQGIDVYSINPIRKYDSEFKQNYHMENFYFIDCPFIFKRTDFLFARKLLKARVFFEDSFIVSFLRNFRVYQSGAISDAYHVSSYDEMLKLSNIICDNSVEEISDEELKENETSFYSTTLKIMNDTNDLMNASFFKKIVKNRNITGVI